MSNSNDAALSAQAAAVRTHFAQTVLPIWRGPGFNAAMQLPYEAVAPDTHAALPVTRYRAMACARQLFVFSQAGDAAHAARLFDSLCRYFRDPRAGGWFFSVDATGAPLDTTKDLYTHAFVVFACAYYAMATGERAALDIVTQTSTLITTRFAGDQGLLNAALDADFSAVVSGPAQNPMMHLAEAYLAAREATGEPGFDARLAGLANAIAAHFVHAPTGAVAELPIGSSDNRLEPGHQFEWFYLVKRAGATIADSGLGAALERAFAFAQRHGVDPVTGGVYAALNADGSIQDPTQRIWAQTEYLRALATRATSDDLALLPAQIERFRTRFLHGSGWYECKTPTGEVARADMPSTTPYHLATAYTALPA